MQQPVVRIGEWLVTPSVNQISRQGRQITLEPRLIDLLMYFAHHPDEVLSRDNIIDHVWMRTIVTNHVVTQSISELRKSLRDGGDSNAEYIVTVPKRGYKLTAPVIWCEENSDEIDNLSTSPPPPIAATNAEPTEGFLPLRLCRPPLCKRRLKGEKAAYRRFLDVGDVPALAGDAGGVYRDVGGRS